MPRPRAPTRELFEFTNRRRTGGKCDLYRCRRCGREMLENTHRFAIHISICKAATDEDKAVALTQLRKTKKYSANMKNSKTSALPERPSDDAVEAQPQLPQPHHQPQSHHQFAHQLQHQQRAYPQQQQPQHSHVEQHYAFAPESEREGFHNRNYYHPYAFSDSRAAPLAHRQSHQYMFGDHMSAPVPPRQNHNVPSSFPSQWGSMFPSAPIEARGPGHFI